MSYIKQNYDYTIEVSRSPDEYYLGFPNLSNRKIYHAFDGRLTEQAMCRSHRARNYGHTIMKIKEGEILGARTRYGRMNHVGLTECTEILLDHTWRLCKRCAREIKKKNLKV